MGLVSILSIKDTMKKLVLYIMLQLAGLLTLAEDGRGVKAKEKESWLFGSIEF